NMNKNYIYFFQIITRKIVWFIALNLIWLAVGNAQNNIDETYEQLSATTSHPQKIRLLVELAEWYNLIRLDSMNAVTNRALHIAQRTNDQLSQAFAYEIRGDYYTAVLKKDSAIFYYRTALTHYENVATTAAKQQQTFIEIEIDHLLNRDAETLARGLELIEYYTPRNDAKSLADAYRIVADAYYYQNKLPESIHYDSLALATIEDELTDLEKADYYTTFANALRFNQQTTKADSFFRIATQLVENQYCPAIKSLICLDHGLMYLERETPEDYRRAKKLYERGLIYARESKEIINECLLLGNLGIYYLSQQEFATAADYLHQSIELGKTFADPYFVYDFYYLLAEAYAGLGKADSSFHYAILGRNAETEEYNTAYDEAIANAQIRFNTAQREAELSASKVIVNRQRWQLGISLVGTLALAVFGLIFYQLNRRLRKRNQEKEFLLKEIHHRVKNNLQILSSLLFLQSHHTEDEVAGEALRDGQHRVQAMGLLHQKLYTTDDMTTVNMEHYTRDLTETLMDALGVNGQQVTVNYQISDLQLDVDTAIPLGLILNELITNSIKHAFNNGQNGALRIELFTNERTELVLRVVNFNTGQTVKKAATKGTGFGSNLIQILGQKLQGTPKVTQTDDTYQTEIVFKRWQKNQLQTATTTPMDLKKQRPIFKKL
ncbi:MAG: sensor histidine kinase, partial [Bacteroidota bacterium]